MLFGCPCVFTRVSACGYGCKQVHGGVCVQVCKWGALCAWGVCTHTRGSGRVCAVGGTHGSSCVCDCVRACVLVADGWAKTEFSVWQLYSCNCFL